MEKLLFVTFYHLGELENYEDMKDELLSYCLSKGLKGTILLALEGINGSVAGRDADVRDLLSFIRRDHRLHNLEWKENSVSFQPFQAMKVRLRKEVVALGFVELENLNPCEVGDYIQPENWAEFISREDVKTIDTRNSYEIMLGRFKHSIDPETVNFRDFQFWVKRWVDENDISKDQKIAMYCTGGIRCEKSTAYMKKIGFKHVYQLRGGIINYLLKTRNEDGAWSGDCFVFDDRVAVNVDLDPVKLSCLDCNRVLDTDDLKNIPKGRVICTDCASGPSCNLS